MERCLQSLEVEELLKKLEVLIYKRLAPSMRRRRLQSGTVRNIQKYFLYNKENGGHGLGINYGIQKATGKYFKVLDGGGTG